MRLFGNASVICVSVSGAYRERAVGRALETFQCSARARPR